MFAKYKWKASFENCKQRCTDRWKRRETHLAAIRVSGGETAKRPFVRSLLQLCLHSNIMISQKKKKKIHYKMYFLRNMYIILYMSGIKFALLYNY